MTRSLLVAHKLGPIRTIERWIIELFHETLFSYILFLRFLIPSNNIFWSIKWKWPTIVYNFVNYYKINSFYQRSFDSYQQKPGSRMLVSHINFSQIWLCAGPSTESAVTLLIFIINLSLLNTQIRSEEIRLVSWHGNQRYKKKICNGCDMGDSLLCRFIWTISTIRIFWYETNDFILRLNTFYLSQNAIFSKFDPTTRWDKSENNWNEYQQEQFWIHYEHILNIWIFSYNFLCFYFPSNV